jgi:hypothetical protein
LPALVPQGTHPVHGAPAAPEARNSPSFATAAVCSARKHFTSEVFSKHANPLESVRALKPLAVLAPSSLTDLACDGASTGALPSSWLSDLPRPGRDQRGGGQLYNRVARSGSSRAR